MKKLILVIFLVIFFLISLGSFSSIAIPDEALRIRIIANSNSEEDQKIKKIIKKKLQIKLYNLLKNTRGVKEARKIINENLNEIDKEVNDVLNINDISYNYNVNYGLNYFPNKEYKGILYDEGYYESLVITLGEGNGDNWWCVLFPPLCLIEAEESDEIEYTSFVKEMIKKYLN